MKKTILTLLFLTSPVMAQTWQTAPNASPYYIQSCDKNVCQMGSNKPAGSPAPLAGATNGGSVDISGFITPTPQIATPVPPEIDKSKLRDNRAVPGGTLLIFCSSPRPPKITGWRGVWDRECRK